MHRVPRGIQRAPSPSPSTYSSTTASDSSDDDSEEQLQGAAFLIVVDHQAALHGARDRRAHRAYLSRRDLLRNPRLRTPFQTVLTGEVDRAYITTMGLDVKTFKRILEAGFEDLWNTSAIPRPDVSAWGEARPGKRSLNAAGGLGLVLYWLNSTMLDKSLAQIFALIPSTITRYRAFALDLLLRTLKSVPEARIVWPEEEDMEKLSELVVARHPLLQGAFGSVDGLNLPTATSSDERWQNAQYNGWLHGHFTSNVLVFSTRGELLHAAINAPGSWHDSRVSSGIYAQLEENTPDPYFLAADTAFPHNRSTLRSKIKTPVKSGTRTTREQVQFLDQLVSFRQSAEWGMRAIQGSFGRLRLPLDANDGRARRTLLETVFRLHQIRVRLVGINQLRSVYEPIWTETKEQKQVWGSLREMFFPDIRKADRVAKFHYIVVEDE
ncbi:hypothetical protein CALCODRAFT_434501 [Calocera cornea HHB12733]|uniref:DDE Tnp4 domain-containing protein n=1 Tax=Calocera cornea HHB12733 TaxID=1353952 RepID=A0A165FVP7_9BASI|nr:hypothetical protein CALCODRAFT_434501 [Calocera cornea HHB12733]